MCAQNNPPTKNFLTQAIAAGPRRRRRAFVCVNDSTAAYGDCPLVYSDRVWSTLGGGWTLAFQSDILV